MYSNSNRRPSPTRRGGPPERSSTGNFAYPPYDSYSARGGSRGYNTQTSPRSSTDRVVPISEQTYINGVPVSGSSRNSSSQPSEYSAPPRRSTYAEPEHSYYRPAAKYNGSQAGSRTSNASSRLAPAVHNVGRAPSADSRPAQHDRDAYVTSSSTNAPRERRKIYPIDSKRRDPEERERDHRQRDSYEQEAPRRDGRDYHLSGPARAPPRVDDSYEYTNARDMFETTEPIRRPRRTSADADSRDRPLSLIDSQDSRTGGARPSGPPPAMRGLDRLNDPGPQRHNSLRDTPSVRSPPRDRERRRESYGEDDNYRVAPRINTRPPESTYSDSPLSPTRSDYDDRRDDRRSSKQWREEIASRGFGIMGMEPDPREAEYDRKHASDRYSHRPGYPPESAREDFRREPEIPRDAPRERDREYEKDVKRDRNTHRMKETEPYRDREPEREVERDRERELVKDREPEAYRDKERDRDRDRNRDRDREAPRARDAESYRDRDVLRDKASDRDRERNRERDTYRDREAGFDDDRRAPRERHHEERDREPPREYERDRERYSDEDRKSRDKPRERDERERRDRDYDSKRSAPSSDTGSAGLASGAGAAGLAGLAGLATSKASKKDRQDYSDEGSETSGARRTRSRPQRTSPGDEEVETRAPSDAARKQRGDRSEEGSEVSEARRTRTRPQRTSPGEEEVRERHYVEPQEQSAQQGHSREVSNESVDPDEEFRRRIQQEAQKMKQPKSEGTRPSGGNDYKAPEEEPEQNSAPTEMPREPPKEETEEERRRNRYRPANYQDPSRSADESKALALVQRHSDDEGPAMVDEPAELSDSSAARENRVSIVEPPRANAGPRGILRKPTVRFPEDPNPIREGVAPLKDSSQKGVPPGSRWTKIARNLVSPAALEEAQERFEVRQDYVIVLRVVPHEEIQKFADRTKEIREERDHGGRDEKDRERHRERDRDRDRERDRDKDRERDRDRERDDGGHSRHKRSHRHRDEDDDDEEEE